MYTTLNRIKAADLGCDRGWNALLAYLGKTEADDQILSIRVIHSALGLMPAIKCLAALHGAGHEKQEFSEFLAEGHTQEEITIKFLELFGD